MSRKRVRRSLSVYTHHNKVRLVHGGQEFFSLLVEMIDQAKTLIHMQTYIFEEDETGSLVADALSRAARRGVQVYLLLDGYASQELSKTFIGALKDGGVHFRWFAPLIKSRHFYFGRRMHHKFIVTDNSRGMAGGINISDRYNDIGGNKAWLDWALYSEGEAAAKLNIIGERMWIKSSWAKSTKSAVRYSMPRPEGIHPAEECLVRVRRNDWVRKSNHISASYLEMFRSATDHITLLSSYFLPGKIFRKQLVRAAGRGVKIRVILGGVSDVKVARLAEQYMYRWMFRNDIEIYEYRESVLHGKLASYDNKWMTVGSYNVNNISAYASIELNMDVLNDSFAEDVQRQLDEIINLHCTKITKENFYSHTPYLKRVLQQTAYLTIRFLFFLFTFYFKQEK